MYLVIKTMKSKWLTFEPVLKHSMNYDLKNYFSKMIKNVIRSGQNRTLVFCHIDWCKNVQ